MGKPFTWPQRFERAMRAGKFTEADKGRAGGWTYCAVGEHNAALIKAHQYHEDDNNDFPPLFYNASENGGLGLVSAKDADRLATLGCDFYEAVFEHKIERAIHIYTEIDKWYEEHPAL